MPPAPCSAERTLALFDFWVSRKQEIYYPKLPRTREVTKQFRIGIRRCYPCYTSRKGENLDLDKLDLLPRRFIYAIMISHLTWKWTSILTYFNLLAMFVMILFDTLHTLPEELQHLFAAASAFSHRLLIRYSMIMFL